MLPFVENRRRIGGETVAVLPPKPGLFCYLEARLFIDLRERQVKYFPLGEHARLDLVVDAFNLLNRTNITQINPWFGAGAQALPTFRRPIEAAIARQLQFSLDFEF
jgi:hypothetical protein